jgi:LysR family transcriptional regulator, benzoate and cis,cis-muconate-responsive activator of ben and cat genes
MPELRHLRYFIAVAEELNFSRAAERLHMAQPPLSVAIRQLEEELGTTLFVRTSREVRLTEAGIVLLDGARRTLAEADAAVVAAQRAASGAVGSLRIGYSWSARFETLPALGRAFKDRHPEVELLAEETWNGRIPMALRARTIDVALALCPDVVDDLTYATVRSEPVVALLSSSHRLASEEAVGLDALADDEFLLFPRDLAPRLHDVLVGYCRAAGFEPAQRNESFHTRWTIGAWEPHAVALVPQSVSRELPDGVAALAITPPELLETQVVWRNGDASAIVAAFGEVATAVFASGIGHAAA